MASISSEANSRLLDQLITDFGTQPTRGMLRCMMVVCEVYHDVAAVWCCRFEHVVLCDTSCSCRSGAASQSSGCEDAVFEVDVSKRHPGMDASTVVLLHLWMSCWSLAFSAFPCKLLKRAYPSSLVCEHAA